MTSKSWNKWDRSTNGDTEGKNHRKEPSDLFFLGLCMYSPYFLRLQTPIGYFKLCECKQFFSLVFHLAQLPYTHTLGGLVPELKLTSHIKIWLELAVGCQSSAGIGARRKLSSWKSLVSTWIPSWKYPARHYSDCHLFTIVSNQFLGRFAKFSILFSKLCVAIVLCARKIDVYLWLLTHAGTQKVD